MGIGAAVDGHEIGQIYYVGVLDPHEQVPPALYRITLRGESSLVNSTRFASGWIDAALVDSLSTKIGFDDAGNIAVKNGEKKLALKTGRRMWVFGPEGFRKVPENHRLVIVMGSSPQAFFAAVDQTLGELDLARRLDNGQVAAEETIAMLQSLDAQMADLTKLEESLR
ncbi:MAG: hypothetical protein AB7I19_09385 [Planctomycetota bacterium]